ncbi:MAG: ribulose 1,5-bisphosphate carboxylase large subunit [Acidobacteria bacterium]|nr:MAG: ribulose 1,5-bisphosphate carboxylase large subunit [Acidobacteriota bacterium]
MKEPENRFEVIYELQIEKGISAFKVAEGICLEQTVEVDRSLVCNSFISDEVVGQIVKLEPLEMGKYRLKVSYTWDVTAGNIPQFFNVLYGNISMKPSIKVVDFIGDHPMFPGPQYGIPGLRKIFREMDHPLLCSAIKPMGHDVQSFAHMAYKMALGGIHMIKDDHGLNDQPFCPFEERVVKVSEAVNKANAETGGNCMYMPNFAPSLENFDHHLDILKRNEIKGILVSPFLIGLDQFRYLATHESFILMAHPTFSGGYLMHENHGMRPGFLLGKLFRYLGADASIYCNIGGRFSFDLATCKDINTELWSVHPRIKSAFPVPAGGMTMSNLGQMKKVYGKDLIFLVGGALLQSEDLTKGVKEFRRLAFAD